MHGQRSNDYGKQQMSTPPPPPEQTSLKRGSERKNMGLQKVAERRSSDLIPTSGRYEDGTRMERSRAVTTSAPGACGLYVLYMTGWLDPLTKWPKRNQSNWSGLSEPILNLLHDRSERRRTRGDATARALTLAAGSQVLLCIVANKMGEKPAGVVHGECRVRW